MNKFALRRDVLMTTTVKQNINIFGIFKLLGYVVIIHKLQKLRERFIGERGFKIWILTVPR